MKTQINRAGALVAAAAALAFPALAIAKKDDHPRGKRDHPVAWNLKGVVTAKGEGTVTVEVKRSNRHGRALRDRLVTFDLSDARIVVRDVNADGVRDLGDVNVGDGAKLHARLPRRQVLEEGQSVAAKRAVFKAPQPEDSGEPEPEQQP
jgi:hypothetical protein